MQEPILGLSSLIEDYSLNKVELLEPALHHTLQLSEGHKAIGKDYRVKYSLIAFSGIISGKGQKN